MERIKKNWWKVLCIILVLYTVIYGFIVEVPDLPVIGQSIRNLFFHVGMWFSMLLMLLLSVIHGIKYLRTGDLISDIKAAEAVRTGILFGILGLLTGMLWAKVTWGKFWISDPKLNGAAISMLIYFAYLILRNSLNELHQRGRIAAVYSIFAFFLYIIFIIVIPRISDNTIHPGKEDNPVLPMDLDPKMRMVFYPAAVGWMLVGVWIWKIRSRISILKHKIMEEKLNG